MVGNGAFVLKEWVPGSYILAARNRYYWNDAATRLEAVKYLLIPDENAELARYRGGELQITFVVPRGQFDWIRANLADQLHVSPQLTTYYYGFNLRRAPFKDNPKLRRALSLVIDREKLAQLVLRVGELPAYGWVPPGVDNYTSQSFDYRSKPLARASPKRSACIARRATRASGRSASSCATTPARCTPSSPSPSPPCGRRRSARRCASRRWSSSRSCRTSIAATWRCSARAGWATTTTPTPSPST